MGTASARTAHIRKMPNWPIITWKRSGKQQGGCQRDQGHEHGEAQSIIQAIECLPK